MENLKTVIIGNEFDSVLIKKLKKIIQLKNGVLIDQEWAIAGSQELEEYSVLINGEVLKVEIETYIGVTLIGNCELIESLVTELSK